jgi:phenylacetate-CoA ligase
MAKRRRRQPPPNRSPSLGGVRRAQTSVPAQSDTRRPEIWPVMSSPAMAQALALQFQLEETERWPPEKLLAHQLYQIQNVIDHAQATVPFHKERLAPFPGWPPGALTLERFRDIPIMDREEVQAAGKDLHSRRLPSGHGPTSVVKTSGSTGRPVEVLATTVTSIMAQALSLRGHLWHERDVSAKSVTVRTINPSRRAAEKRRWVPLPHGGPSVTIDDMQPVAEIFERLLREDPAYLECRTSLTLALAQLSAETGRKPKSLRQVRNFGEALDPWVHAYCRGVWGVPIVNNYSSEEFGTIAHECAQSETLHVQSESVFVEVLDDHNRPCGPGQSGRILVTALLNYGTPLIRYDLGDIVEIGGPCACGRGLPVLKQIRGRTKDLIHLPNGGRMHGYFWNELGGFPKVRQFQVIQTSLESLHLKLVASAPLDESERLSLIELMQKQLVHKFQIHITYHGEIPREPSGKYMIFKSELGSLEDSMAG